MRSKGEESSRNAEFEKNNGAFCSQYVDDMKVREKAVTKKHESAESFRLKGTYVRCRCIFRKASYGRNRVRVRIRVGVRDGRDRGEVIQS